MVEEFPKTDDEDGLAGSCGGDFNVEPNNVILFDDSSTTFP